MIWALLNSKIIGVREGVGGWGDGGLVTSVLEQFWCPILVKILCTLSKIENFVHNFHLIVSSPTKRWGDFNFKRLKTNMGEGGGRGGQGQVHTGAVIMEKLLHKLYFRCPPPLRDFNFERLKSMWEINSIQGREEAEIMVTKKKGDLIQVKTVIIL